MQGFRYGLRATHYSRLSGSGIIFVTMKNWIKRKVHAYEKMRFDQEPVRAKLPFEWGLEHIGGEASERDPRKYLETFVAETIAGSDAWYASRPAQDYKLEGNVLTFTSAINSPWAENNRVYAQYFPASGDKAAATQTGRSSVPERHVAGHAAASNPIARAANGNGQGSGHAPAQGKGRAVVVLAQWNARWDEQQGVCKWLNKMGITAVKVSLPYHDRRAIPGHRRADHLVAPNIGLTLQANRQAVVDVRATLRWLEQQGYDRLGVLGTSIGSCIGFITMCHDPAVRAGAFLHASMYFGDVVANGLTTVNVWEQMARHVTPEDLQRYWSPISPLPYLNKLPGRDLKMLLITGKYDPTFWPEFTDGLFASMRREGIDFKSLRLPCGHYSLGITPFKHVAGYRFGKFLAEALG